MQNTNVPTNWHFIKLGEACAFSQGVQIDLEKQKAEPFFGGIPFLRIENYTQSSTDIRYIPESLSKNKVICEDDVVVVRYGATAGFVGKGLKGVLANNLFKVEPRADLLTKQFLFIKLKEPKAFRYFQNAMFGGAMPALSFSMVSPFKILLPPLEEQKKIAEILGTWDRAIEELTDLIAEKKELKRGLMQRLLTGSQRLPGFSKTWKKIKCADVLFERKTYLPKGKELEHVSLTKEGVVPKTARYERDFLVRAEEKEYKITKFNDICYNPANLKFGVICRNTYGDGIFSPIYVTFEIKNIDSVFLGFIVKTHMFQGRALRYEQGTVYERMAVSAEDLLKMKLEVPADSAEQKAIADVLSKADSEIDLLNQRLDVLKEQKRGLMQKLLTGEIRVKVDME